MTIHVFVGVGPANLHRAIKIRKLDPKAELIFIDKRLQPGSEEQIDRKHARANIFRFENKYVTDKLIDDNVNLKGLIHQRKFDVAKAFQFGDDNVFSSEDFTQIQIRDLQLAFFKTLFAAEKTPILINTNIESSTHKKIAQDVTEIVEKVLRKKLSPDEEVKIHIASGALMDNPEKHEIVYPEKTTHYMPEATDDVKSMTVTPLHGTTTYFIKDPATGENKVTCDELRDNQCSLDTTPWQEPLKKFGWNLVRPPRIRVFYANDILYIGSEIPVSMSETAMPDKKAFEQAVADYNRTIATLVFPKIASTIKNLPVNEHLRTRFATPRGERGDVIHTIPTTEDTPGITIFHHGDARYLPHYQTGSGFVTAFLQNELYAEIYGCQTFTELADFITRHTGEGVDETTIKSKYLQLVDPQNNKLSPEAREKAAFEACQKELFMAFSRDIIEENKAKVGRYLNALHRQELKAFAEDEMVFDRILQAYSNHTGIQFGEEDFNTSTQRMLAVIELLKTNNIGFLREILPQLLNKDFTRVDNKQLLYIRDMHVIDYENNLPRDESNTLSDEITTEQRQVRAIISRTTTDKLIQDLFQKQTFPMDVSVEPKDLGSINKDPLHHLLDTIVNTNDSLGVAGNLKHFISLDDKQLVTAITRVADEFNKRPDLHRRAAVPVFFTGKHSATIHEFVRQLREIATENSQNPDLMRIKTVDSVLEFQKKLQDGHSRRTLAALKEISNEVFTLANSQHFEMSPSQ
ncbi:hypothetical protein [Legionella hackeliae]|uniref:Uncharacterized protein n=1 Tax=Legionella hackeliae TaxID=449 RepID=A0A0A8UVC1_LEGHA|nr:hypothetical protein [Legionella hackeliae]KTD15175.1 hypothetical protein Lhac_0017 [Legionella hackeliae]CEK11461.1 protein of unknown function [Legionella hackeliae]STX48232.1 Uncharacterised protein [Legionella hackeliae]